MSSIRRCKRGDCNAGIFFEWIKGGNYAGVTVAPSGLKNKLLRYAKERPDEVKLIADNEDGSAFFHVPINYVKISPPRKVSEAQREAAGQRLREWQQKKKVETEENETE